STTRRWPRRNRTQSPCSRATRVKKPRKSRRTSPRWPVRKRPPGTDGGSDGDMVFSFAVCGGPCRGAILLCSDFSPSPSAGVVLLVPPPSRGRAGVGGQKRSRRRQQFSPPHPGPPRKGEGENNGSLQCVYSGLELSDPSLGALLLGELSQG